MKKVGKISAILGIFLIVFVVGMPILIVYETVLFFAQVYDRVLEVWYNEN
jgi:hypothetical protein